MISLKLNQKLLLFWLGSIFVSLLLFGIAFLVMSDDLHQKAAREQISGAFEILEHQIGGRDQYLLQTTSSFAERDDIIASLNMLQKYQDIEHYQSNIFDTEKKKLGLELVELLKAENVNVIMAHDGYMRLASFAYLDVSGQVYRGYLSYENSKPKYFVSIAGVDDFHQIKTLPFLLKASETAEFEKHNKKHTYINRGMIVNELHVSVMRKMKKEYGNQAGQISIIEVVGNEFANNLRKYADLVFMFSSNGGGWFSSSQGNDFDKMVSDLANIDLSAGDMRNWKLVSRDGYFYGIASHSIMDGHDLKFIFSGKSDLISEVKVFQKAMILVLLVNLFIILPLGVLFLRSKVLLPIRLLVNSIKSLERGEYKKIPLSPGKDELAFLTNSLNSMVSAIQVREHELQKLSLAVEQSPISMIITNLEGDIEYVNPAFSLITGYGSDEVMGENTRFLRGEETSVEVYQELWRTISDGKEWSGILHNRKKDGDYIWVASNIIPIKSPNGETINYLALNQNITQRKLDEEQLNIQAAALHAAADGIVITDNNGTIQWVNPAYEEITGYTFEEVLGKNTRLLKSGRQDKSFYERLWQTILSGETWQDELHNKRKDGDIYLEEESITPVMNVSGEITHFVAIKRDITGQRKHEEIVRQSRKLEAIGEMAGGIAHDFNNLLGIISGNLEILKRFSGDNPDMNKWIDSGLKTAKRGAALTKRLLGFSRVHAAEVKTVSVSNMLEDMLTMIEKTAGPRIVVHYGLEPDLWLADIDAGDLEDAVINLVINAKDAMQGKGRLDVSVYNEMVDEDKASNMLDSRAGDYVVLCVSDSGSGISEEVQQRMFDPFYSTKDKGKGTGLGLSLVHGFVRRSHGRIDVVSEPDVGTTFRIYLPRSVKDKLKGLDSGEKDVLPTGTETILVVDDEVQLAEVATIYLGDLGYRVLQATDTKQAMAFLQGGEKIDLLFSDIIMPGSMDGFDLSDVALRLRPEIKVLLVSGYTPEDSGISEQAKKLADQRLAKPYSKIELAQRVRLVLDGERK